MIWCIFITETRLNVQNLLHRAECNPQKKAEPESIVMSGAHSPRILARVVDWHRALKKKFHF